MTHRKILEPYIGSTLLRARKLNANDSDVCAGIQFDFKKGSFAVMAVAENDSISIESMTNMASNTEEREKIEINPLDTLRSSAYVGQIFVNYWLCESEPDYVDSIDFGFGDLNYPSIKLFCSLSEVLEFPIGR